MRAGAVRLLVCALAAGSVVAGPAAASSAAWSAAPPSGLQVVGNQLTRDGQPFLMRGFNMIGALAGPDCTGQAAITTAAGHLTGAAGAAEMAALAGTWHANTVRFQVLQASLTDPVPANVSAYVATVSAAVTQAHAAGLAVILSMQDQYKAGCGGLHPMPSQATVAAWTALAPTFAADPDVAFELYNEPHDGPGAGSGQLPAPGQWDEWLDGGSSPEPNLGDPAVGHQQLVDDIRALGATNVLIADGLNKAGQLQGLPLLHDTLPTPNIAYGIHPYYYTLGYLDWDYRFGDAATQVPVVATEWNYKTGDCGSLQQSMAPGFLSYLATRGIGVLGHAGDLVTGNQLMADWSWDPTDCGTPASGPGVDFLAATTATVSPRASKLTLTGDSGFSIGNATVLTGGLLVAGAPAPGVPLTLTRKNPDGTTTVLPAPATDGSGTFQVTDTPTGYGTSTYTVAYGGNAGTAAASQSFDVVVLPVGTFLHADGPSSAPRAVPLTITGLLTAGDTATAAQQITWTRTDLDGTVTLAPLTTDSGGSFVATDTPPVGGPVTYDFRYAGDSTHGTSTATVPVDVSRLTPDLTVAVSKPVLKYNASGTVTVHLGPTHTGRIVSLYEYDYGVPSPTWTLVHTGPVDGAGNYVLSMHFTRHVDFQASYPGDEWYASWTSPVATATALAKLATTVSGSYGRSGSYHLVHTGVDPAVRAVLAPARGAVGCVTFTAQALTGGAWKTVATTACVPVDAAGGATGLPLATHSVSVSYRVRASIATDTLNAATNGSWLYVRFSA